LDEVSVSPVDLRPLVGVPVVDLGDTTALVSALSTVGFVAVRGHGVPDADLSAMRGLLVDLFAVGEEAKARQSVSRDDYRGFIPLRAFSPNRAGEDPPDAFEGYKLHWECPTDHPVRAECALYGSNRWADHLPEMASVVGSWWAAMDCLADRLVDSLADSLGLNGLAGQTMAATRTAPLTNVTLLHYPRRRPDDLTPGFHPHKDITVVTILDPDPVGGLEMRSREGSWMEAECPEGALLVNVGDLLEVWSGGRLVSTPHRVTNPVGVDRYSAPFFVVPNHRVVVEPLLEPVAGFRPRSVPVGAVTAEVWRTNWPDEAPSDPTTHLGTVDA
jgi:isopenicillin N synthase-like dioxygenase